MSLAQRMACWSSRNLLDLYVDGRLTLEASRGVAAHLEACAACRAEERALRPVKVAGGPAAPAGLAEAILKQLESGAEPRPAAAPSLRLAPAQAAAAVALGILAAGNAAPGGSTSEGLPGRPGLEALP